VRAINGRATIAQIVEASPNPTERASRFRQVYLLMSTMAVRASMEPIPMTSSAAQQAQAQAQPLPEPMPVAAPQPPPDPAPRPVASAAGVVQPRKAPVIIDRTQGPPASSGGGDEGVVFTPDEDAARQ